MTVPHARLQLRLQLRITVGVEGRQLTQAALAMVVVGQQSATRDSNRIAVRLVMAISAMEVSAIFHTSGSSASAPNITMPNATQRKMIRPPGWLCSRNTVLLSA